VKAALSKQQLLLKMITFCCHWQDGLLFAGGLAFVDSRAAEMSRPFGEHSYCWS
jgi:hypothetical protein